MATYSVNDRAVAHARKLIKAKQYVLDSDWGEVQPKAESENSFLESHDWDDYSEWFLGLTEGAAEETKARYAFVYGDLRRVHHLGPDRLRLSSIRVASQGDRVGRARPPTAPRHDELIAPI